MSTPFDKPRDPNRPDLGRPRVDAAPIDGVLRASLAGALAEPGEGCVDAETLAAWADGGLLSDASAVVEAHLAGCADCQALAAMFARTDVAATAAESSAPAHVVPFRPRRPLTWLAPLAAAAALVTWLAWPAGSRLTTSPAPPEAAQTLARAEQPPPNPGPPPSPAPPTASASGTVQNLAGRDAKVGPGRERVAAPAAEPAPIVAPKQNIQAQSGERTAARPGMMSEPVEVAARTGVPAPAAPPPPPSVAPSTPPVPLPQAPPVQVSSRDFGRTSGAQAPVLDALSSTAGLTGNVAAVIEIAYTAPPAQSMGESVVVTPRPGAAGGRGGGVAGRGAGFGAAALPAPPVARPTRWRILGGTRVESSADAGTTWVPVTIELPSPLTGGVATAPGICWLIGQRGLVVITIDGLSFERVTAPAAVDLTSIRATDARQATVTTSDGRTFSTSDGGRTWQVRLQGFSPSPF